MVKSWLTIRPPFIPLSFRMDRRVPLVLGVLGMLTLVVAIFSVGYGEFPISPVDVVKTVLGLTTNRDYGFVIYTLRLPRIVAAFLVGMGLAIAGTILQGLTRNPLAAPEIVGVDAGASLAA